MTARGGRLHLAFELPNGSDGNGGIPAVLVPVLWREQRHLVGSEDLVALPAAVKAMLLPSPVDGTITKVISTLVEEGANLPLQTTIATIDRGGEHGLQPGHVVHFTTGGNPFLDRSAVTEVSARSARNRVRGVGPARWPAPAVGWQWSTRSPGAR